MDAGALYAGFVELSVSVCILFAVQFYAMVDFCNPGCLGTPAEFRRHFEAPILAGEVSREGHI